MRAHWCIVFPWELVSQEVPKVGARNRTGQSVLEVTLFREEKVAPL